MGITGLYHETVPLNHSQRIPEPNKGCPVGITGQWPAALTVLLATEKQKKVFM
jgi:hypothetical protein